MKCRWSLQIGADERFFKKNKNAISRIISCLIDPGFRDYFKTLNSCSGRPLKAESIDTSQNKIMI